MVLAALIFRAWFAILGPLMSKHSWKFFRAGGVDQVSLETAADLLNLDQLDQKLWVALSCPVKGLEFDSKTLELIDTDKDGRIRAPDIIAAAKWAGSQLKDPNILLKPTDALPLSAIRDDNDESRRLLSSAQEILRSLNRKSDSISVADTTDTQRIFSATNFNGDGIVPAAAGPDPATQQVLAEIITTLGGEIDRTNSPGVSQAKSDQFFKEAEAFTAWHQQSESAGVLPLGDKTVSAVAALDGVRAKIEDYFVRCRLAAFDPRALTAVNRPEAEYLPVVAKDMIGAAPEMVGFPIARIEPGAPLPLVDRINPAWQSAITKFRDEVVRPLLGEKADLTESQWNDLNSRFAAFRAWQSVKAGGLVERLGLPRVREILAGASRATINDLIARDKALEPEMNAIVAVDRLVRYHRDLFNLTKNFVSFADFYTGRKQAIFQAGRLYLDARSCDFCVKIADVAKHAPLATLSRMYIAYCDCTRRGSTEKMTILAGFTGGDSDNLMVGRNGIFYDRAGNDWDATIVRIVEHPISIRQAILAPYKRIGKMIGDQIEKFAASRDKALTDNASTGIAAQAKALETGPAPATAAKPAKQEPFDAAKFAGIFAAIGLAVGAIGTALASVAAGFWQLKGWQMPLAILGVLVMISGPSVIIAVLKLRQRNIGPILDGCGWAVNGLMKINIPFGTALTCIAKVPHEARLTLIDPFADKKRGQKWAIFFLLLGLILWFTRYSWVPLIP